MARKDGAAGGGGGAANEGPFHEPRLAINRVYTKKGDDGRTALVGGQRVPKDDARIEGYGTVDELNAFVGAARQTLLDEASVLRATAMGPGHTTEEAERGLATADELLDLAATLRRVQHELFNLGSLLATLPEDVHPKQPRITEVEVAALEAAMDACQTRLAPLRSFVLPGGCRANADLHVCRTVCRRAERRVVALAAEPAARVDPAAVHYLNRLSDAFFVWSRWVTATTGASEVLWEPNAAASGSGAG